MTTSRYVDLLKNFIEIILLSVQRKSSEGGEVHAMNGGYKTLIDERKDTKRRRDQKNVPQDRSLEGKQI